MWVQLASGQQLCIKGRLTMFQPGDWVDVGKQTALAWVASGQAKVIGAASQELFADCGILAREPAPSMFGPVPVTVDRTLLAMLYPKTFVWDGHVKLPPPMLAVGFALLDKWEAAIPLKSYTDLAASVGNDADRAATLAAVRDARVLLYEPGAMFLRQCDATRLLLERWKAEREKGGNGYLAFLRALYATPLLICALPTTWTGARESE